MASCTIVDESSVVHSKSNIKVPIALTETAPEYHPSLDRSQIESHHISFAIRPSTEFYVVSVEDIYRSNGKFINSTEHEFCSYCGEERECLLLTCSTIPGVTMSQKSLLESESMYKTEKTTTHLCHTCFEEIMGEIENILSRNSAELAISEL